MEGIAKELIEKVAHVEESTKSAHKRLDSLETLTKSVYALAESIKTMQGEISSVSDRLRNVEEKPAKRWDLIITSAITTVVGIVIGHFLGV